MKTAKVTLSMLWAYQKLKSQSFQEGVHLIASTIQCASQSLRVTLSPTGGKYTDPEFKHRYLWWHLQMLAQFCPGTLHQSWKQLSETRGLKQGKMNNTCSFLWDCQPFNYTETGCQRALHTLPTTHMQLTYMWPVSKDEISMVACPYVTHCGSCARPMPQTGILTFAVQICRI